MKHTVLIFLKSHIISVSSILIPVFYCICIPLLDNWGYKLNWLTPIQHRLARTIGLRSALRWTDCLLPKSSKFMQSRRLFFIKSNKFQQIFLLILNCLLPFSTLVFVANNWLPRYLKTMNNSISHFHKGIIWQYTQAAYEFIPIISSYIQGFR